MLALGLGFAVLIILVFLLSVRSTLVTAISIPTSVLITFVGIQAFGQVRGNLTRRRGRVIGDEIQRVGLRRHRQQVRDRRRRVLAVARPEVVNALPRDR